MGVEFDQQTTIISLHPNSLFEVVQPSVVSNRVQVNLARGVKLPTGLLDDSPFVEIDRDMTVPAAISSITVSDGYDSSGRPMLSKKPVLIIGLPTLQPERSQIAYVFIPEAHQHLFSQKQ